MVPALALLLSLLATPGARAPQAQPMDGVSEPWQREARWQPRPVADRWETLVERWLYLAEPLTERRQRTLVEPDVWVWNHDVQAGVCYAVLAWGRTMADLDIDVHMNGVRVAQDAWPDAWPLAAWCAAASGRVEIRIEAFRGSGPVEAQVFAVPESRVMAEGPLDELSNRLLALQARAAPSARAAAPQSRHALPEPGVIETTWTVEGGSCAVVLGVGTAGVVDLDLVLVDAGGQVLSQDFSRDPTAVVAACADETGPWTLRALVVQGRGSIALQVLVPTHP
jgi:hypothetical protein